MKILYFVLLLQGLVVADSVTCPKLIFYPNGRALKDGVNFFYSSGKSLIQGEQILRSDGSSFLYGKDFKGIRHLSDGRAANYPNGKPLNVPLKNDLFFLLYYPVESAGQTANIMKYGEQFFYPSHQPARKNGVLYRLDGSVAEGPILLKMKVANFGVFVAEVTSGRENYHFELDPSLSLHEPEAEITTVELIRLRTTLELHVVENKFTVRVKNEGDKLQTCEVLSHD